MQHGSELIHGVGKDNPWQALWPFYTSAASVNARYVIACKISQKEIYFITENQPANTNTYAWLAKIDWKEGVA
jgi:hypothetical protein